MGYEIDQKDRLRALVGDWAGFAQGNDGIGLSERSVLGRSVWSYFSGGEIADLMEQLFRATRRQGVPLSVAQRCDAPGMIRRYEMRIVPLSRDGLRITHVPRGVTPCGPVTPGHPVWHTKPLERCAVCCDYKLGDRWQMVPLGERQLPEVDHYTVCPKCRARADAAMGATGG